MHHSFCIDRLQWGSTVGHPSNSRASCYASVQRSVTGGILFLSCASVCAFRNNVNMIACRVFGTFSPTSTTQYGTGITYHILGSKGQRSRSQWNTQYAGNSTFNFHNSLWAERVHLVYVEMECFVHFYSQCTCTFKVLFCRVHWAINGASVVSVGPSYL